MLRAPAAEYPDDLGAWQDPVECRAPPGSTVAADIYARRVDRGQHRRAARDRPPCRSPDGRNVCFTRPKGVVCRSRDGTLDISSAAPAHRHFKGRTVPAQACTWAAWCSFFMTWATADQMKWPRGLRAGGEEVSGRRAAKRKPKDYRRPQDDVAVMRGHRLLRNRYIKHIKPGSRSHAKQEPSRLQEEHRLRVA